MSLSLSLLLCGCSDKSEQLRPGDAYRYKMQLLRERHREITPQLQKDFMYHPGRTRAELDSALEGFVAKTRRMQEAERARHEAERAAEREVEKEGEGPEEGAETSGEGEATILDSLSDEDEGDGEP